MPDQPAPDFEEARQLAAFWNVYSPLPSDSDWPWENMHIVARAYLALLREREAREEVINAAQELTRQGEPPICVGLGIKWRWRNLNDRLAALPATESAQAEHDENCWIACPHETPPDRNSGHSPEEVVEQPTSEAGS